MPFVVTFHRQVARVLIMSKSVFRSGFGPGVFALGVLATATLGIPDARSQSKPVAVVELFTSQGCSSCPAADKILSEYARKKQVLALSWHVDYWNYLGWKDTFSKPEFTKRQQRYAVSFKRRGLYTPQAVVNGRAHAVGSDGKTIRSLMASYQSSGKGLTVPLTAVRRGETIEISASSAQSGRAATMWVVYFDRKKPVKIERGENRGKTITYHNVVQDFSMLGMMKNGEITVTLPLDEMKRKGFDACAILLQETTEQGTPGAIVGATVVDDLAG